MRDRRNRYNRRHMLTALLPLLLVCGVRSERKFSIPTPSLRKVVKVQLTNNPGLGSSVQFTVAIYLQDQYTTLNT